MTDHELDALVAEKVMGFSEPIKVRKNAQSAWETVFRKGPGYSYAYERLYLEDGTKLYCGKPWVPYRFSCYSSNIRDAWLVVEEMRRRGKIMSMHAVPNSKDWCVAFGPDGEILDPSAPRAIALAALRALGVEVTA